MGWSDCHPHILGSNVQRTLYSYLECNSHFFLLLVALVHCLFSSLEQSCSVALAGLGPQCRPVLEPFLRLCLLSAGIEEVASDINVYNSLSLNGIFT